MLEIREQILSVIKEKKSLMITDESSQVQEVIEFKDNEFFYIGINIKTQQEEFGYLLTEKQALSKICDYYRSKGNITAVPGYKEVYAYMMKHI